MNNDYKLLVEGKYESIDFLEKNELDFFLKKELIVRKGNAFKVAFVGEIITTENSYFSLPKNFEKTEENVDLFKKVLNVYRTFKKENDFESLLESLVLESKLVFSDKLKSIIDSLTDSKIKREIITLLKTEKDLNIQQNFFDVVFPDLSFFDAHH